MDASSPTKRRVLGSLDPNASPRPRLGAKQQSLPTSPLKKVTVFSSAPELEPKKRQLLTDAQATADLLHPAKKVCHEDDREEPQPHERRVAEDMQEIEEQPSSAPDMRQSASPEPSSVFDSSAIDTSQDTTATELDIGATTAPAPTISLLGTFARLPTRPRLTREEAREKAEILRLRLGLASYKLRTGQTDVPLEQLEMMRHAPSPSAVGVGSSSPARNGAGWASSKLQSQLRLQGIAAAATATSSSYSNLASSRRPLPGGPVRRTSRDGTESASPSFSSLVDFSQESAASRRADDVDGAAAADKADVLVAQAETEGGEASSAQLPRLPLLSAQTPRRHLGVGVEVDEERLTSSALRGGAASGLLSLARS